MDKNKMRSAHLVLAATSALAVANGRTAPTANQLLYQQREVSMFMHYSMCTYAPNGGCEQDTECRKNTPALFNPEGLNTTQWVETAAKLGAKEVCLTAHHTGGFALWQTNVTDYGIKESPYKGGKGDIVKEFTDSCRQFGMSPCLYFINAWDCWESGDTAEVYVEKQLAMLTELSDGRYGHIDRFWFDEYGFGASPGQSPAGSFPAAWPRVAEHVHNVSPGTMMLPGPDGCINPGEGGQGAYPVYNYVNNTNMCSYPGLLPAAQQAASSPSPNGQIFVPYESDLSIQNPGDAWFYHEGHPFLNAAELWDHYLDVVGRGSHFILNVPPNTTGVIAEGFVQAVTVLGDAVRASFGPGTEVGSKTNVTGPCSSFVVIVPATATTTAATTAAAEFNAVVMQETLTTGQFILEYSLDVQGADGKWTPVSTAAGKTVGHKLIDLLPAAPLFDCSVFQCTCKGMGNYYGIGPSPGCQGFGCAPLDAQHWWVNTMDCQTTDYATSATHPGCGDGKCTAARGGAAPTNGSGSSNSNSSKGSGGGSSSVRSGNSAVRFKCVNAIGGLNTVVSLSSISLHKVLPPALPLEHGTLRSYYSADNMDTAPCAFRDGGTCATFTGAKYTLVREEAVVLNTRAETDPDTKWVHLEYSLAAKDNGLADGTNAKFSPPGYADESSVDKMVVWTSAGPGRIKLDSYYSAVKKDFWVVGSNTSRTEAIARGYVLVGTVGYGMTPTNTAPASASASASTASLSSAEDDGVPATSQSAAAAAAATAHCSPSDDQKECTALVELYTSTQGATSWTRHAGWLDGKTFCGWEGVTCDAKTRSHVVVLNLTKNGLNGTLHTSIGNSLSHLTELYLQSNNLVGTIPLSLGALSQLTQLNLWSNKFVGTIPATLGNLANLQNLNIYNNGVVGSGSGLTGSIPAALGKLPKLLGFRAAHNQLSGEIPAELGQIATLQALHLFNNELTGSVPASLGGLANLEQLDFANNMLTGLIPSTLCPFVHRVAPNMSKTPMTCNFGNMNFSCPLPCGINATVCFGHCK